MLTLALFLSLHQQAKAQLPTVPEQMQFADQLLTLSQADRDSIARWAEPLVRNNKYLRSYVDRADAFMPIVQRILQEEGVPDDLKYIVLVESSLTSDLVSKSNAVGYWQFKYATAQDYNLRCDSIVDERKSIVSATRAAARYLGRSNKVLDNWIFSCISYYQGLKGAKDLLGTELVGAKEFVLEKLAHKYAYKVLAHKLVFQELLFRNGLPLLQVDEYNDCGGQALTDIAAAAGMEVARLKEFNKWLRADTVPTDKPYTIILPSTSENRHLVLAMVNKPVAGITQDLKPYEGKKVFFNLITIKDERLDTAGKSAEYKSQIPLLFEWNGLKAIMARPGDNINKLALQGGLDRDDFLDYNDMKVFDLIGVGQVYYLEGKRRKGKVPFHIVTRDGETMWEISQNYGVKLKHLLRKNRMDKPELLKAGRVIYLRRDRAENEPVEYKPVPKVGVQAMQAPKPLNKEVAAAIPRVAQYTAKRPAATTAPAQGPTSGANGQQAAKSQSTSAPVSPVAPTDTKVEPKALEPRKDATPAPKPAAAVAPKAVAKEPVKEAPPEEPVANPYAALAQDNLSAAEADTLEGDVENPQDALPEAKAEAATAVAMQEQKPAPTALPANKPATPAPDVEKSLATTQSVVVQPVAQQQTPPAMPRDSSQPGAKLPPVPKYMRYTLLGGETLFAVAEKLQVPLDSLISWNNINETTMLKPGVELKFRPAMDLKLEAEQAALKAKQAKATPAKPEPKPEQKPVAKPEPRSQEAPVEQMPVRQPATPVKPAPQAPSTQAPAPQTPSATPNATPKAGPQYHTVASGETAFRIAKQYGITVQQLLEWNGKSSPTLTVGERLVVSKP